MRILALVPGGIGDQILFFPTLADLKATYPDATIDVIVEPRARGAYRLCPWVSGVQTFDYKGRSSAADIINFLGNIRDREYDVALSLGSRWTVGFLLWLNGIPRRIGYQSAGRFFLTDTVALNPEQYAASLYHDLLKGLGIQTPSPIPQVSVPKPDIAWAEAEQERLDLKGKSYVLIHGGSSQLARTKGIDKIYPVAKWQQIIADIQVKQPQLPIAVLQGPEDAEWVAELQEKAPDIKVIQPPDLGKLAATIGGASLMLCTDSAPMHLSVAVGTYTIALFGPTDPAKLLPPNSDRCVGIQSPTGAIGDIPVAKILERVWRS